MSYMRGANYLWADDQHLHVWVADGHDRWKESGWYGPVSKRGRRPAGVRVERGAMDEYVVMRFAELAEGALASAAIDRALAGHQGNAGCNALTRIEARLRAALTGITPRPGGHALAADL